MPRRRLHCVGSLIVEAPGETGYRGSDRPRGDSPELAWPAPHPLMSSCVVVPVRDEDKRLGSLIGALAGQRDLQGAPLLSASYEVLLLLNNCTDRSAEVARKMQYEHPALHLSVIEISFAPQEAHVGKARQTLFEAACRRFQFLQRSHGLILTTDADSRPASDWIAQNEDEIAQGVDAVGGRILLEPDELAALPRGVRRLFLLDIGYRRALEEMHALYAPDAHDPFPRHHQNFGGSLAVTAAAYRRAGGMPLKPFREDVGLYHALVDCGSRFRHSLGVRVYTSGRMIGRARGGLADAFAWWTAQVRDAAPIVVESASAAEVRFRELGLWCLNHPNRVPPSVLTTTPDEPSPGQAADVYTTLCALRERIETLRTLMLPERLQLRLGEEEKCIEEAELAA